MPRAIVWRRIGMADRADSRRCSFKEQLLMTADARFVMRIIGYIRKRILLASDLVPICRWKWFMTAGTLELVRLGAVGKVYVSEWCGLSNRWSFLSGGEF